MITRTIDNFKISQICDSGQCFRMTRREDDSGGGRYSVIASGRYLEVRQQGKECVFDCSEEEFEDFWKEYFDLDTDYSFYISQINPNDSYLKEAAQFGDGIRILRQDLWEMIVSFLISQQNNIVRIRRCIENICECYGEPKTNFRGETYFTFPEPEKLAFCRRTRLRSAIWATAANMWSARRGVSLRTVQILEKYIACHIKRRGKSFLHCLAWARRWRTVSACSGFIICRHFL